MNTRWRQYVFPLMLITLLVSVSGCATHGKPPPVERQGRP